MSRMMLVNAKERGEVRVAIVSGGVLEDYHVERTSHESLLGNIYKGIIKNVHRSLQACFIDIGIGKNGFLHVSEIPRPLNIPADIEKLVAEGQDVLIQLKRDSFGDKGPLLTMHVSIPGRFFIFTPAHRKIVFSKKIKDEQRRSFLRNFIKKMNPPRDTGIIVRTASMYSEEDELEADFQYLSRVWRAINSRYHSQPAPIMLYQEVDVVLRTLREYFSSHISEVLIDDPACYQKARDFFSHVIPKFVDRVKFYSESVPIFYNFQIEDQINQLNQSHIKLPSGGMIVIEQTEALTAIDVNSESYVTGKDAEELALKVNLEATREILKQIRLRDIGGIIVIDYIHMKDKRSVEKVEKALRQEVRKDRAQVVILPMSEFCLTEIARQKTKPSLRFLSYSKCPTCHGSGLVKSAESLNLELIRQMKALVQRPDVAVIEVYMGENVRKEFLAKSSEEFEKIERDYGKKIYIYELKGDSPDKAEMVCFSEDGTRLAEYKS